MTFTGISASDLNGTHLGRLIKVRLLSGEGITGSLRQVRLYLDEDVPQDTDYAETREITVRFQEADVPVRLTRYDRLEILADDGVA